jgi:hypothetical protein
MLFEYSIRKYVTELGLHLYMCYLYKSNGLGVAGGGLPIRRGGRVYYNEKAKSVGFFPFSLYTLANPH